MVMGGGVIGPPINLDSFCLLSARDDVANRYSLEKFRFECYSLRDNCIFHPDIRRSKHN